MVTRDQMVEMSRRHDTQVAAAFRRALGVKQWPMGKRKKKHRRRRHRKHSELRGMRECFRNEASPMDLARC